MPQSHRASLLALDAKALRDVYANGSVSPVEVAEATLDAALEAKRLFAAVTSLNREDALAAASASESRWKTGEPLGPLDGVPITFKDSFNIAGLPRWHGSAVNVGAVSGHDAAPVRRAREAGLVIIGKTAMPDYGMLMSGLSSHSGIVRNPWDRVTNPSGSSAGAAACLACGVAPLAVGTDMVGSVRLPAAVSGLVAIHATQGRVAYDPPGNYRGAGPMSRNVADAAALLNVIGQHDPADHFALPGRFEWDGALVDDVRGVKIAVLSAISYGDPVDVPTATAIATQASRLADLGAEVSFLADFDLLPEDYEAVYWTMVHRGLAEFYAAPAARRGLVLPEIARMFDTALGQTALSMDINVKRIANAVARLEKQLAPFDYVLSPVLPVRAFSSEAISPDPREQAMSHMGFACWFNQLGRPAGTVPVLDLGKGLCPVSIQIAGRRFDDAGVLKLLSLIERRRGFDISFPILGRPEEDRKP
jgi:Asp-tRNA(Asn)/Glu-tRNA(Gln) amidotransferase A subunit family amidase